MGNIKDIYEYRKKCNCSRNYEKALDLIEEAFGRGPNEYGMPVQKSSKKDDEAAFTAIHVMRYLYTKKSGKFGTLAERDMIFELISEAWSDFLERVEYKRLRTAEKVSKFREYVIFFPTFTVPDSIETEESGVIYADFGSDLCACGSGLPYLQCCGRIKTIAEIENGIF